jgi:hypothetical protein
MEDEMSAVSTLQQVNISNGIVKGVIAGLGGGVVFGMMMAMMGMLPMVAGLIGSESAVVGAIVHMAISAAIGAFYGAALVLGRFRLTNGFALISGMINGVIWWVLGALILMPLGLGMVDMVFQIGSMQWLSLMGHLIYGVITGLLFVWLIRKGSSKA